MVAPAFRMPALHGTEGVHPGGIFAAAIYLEQAGCDASPHNPEFLLHAGELRCLFADWKVLYYSEGAGADGARRMARIIARRA